MMMLLTSAPVLMDAPAARHFLKQSQHMGGVMARTAIVYFVITGGHLALGRWRSGDAASRYHFPTYDRCRQDCARDRWGRPIHRSSAQA